MVLGFMQGIGGEVESYKFDFEASKKLSDLRAVISMMEEVKLNDDTIHVIAEIIFRGMNKEEEK